MSWANKFDRIAWAFLVPCMLTILLTLFIDFLFRQCLLVMESFVRELHFVKSVFVNPKHSELVQVFLVLVAVGTTVNQCWLLVLIAVVTC